MIAGPIWPGVGPPVYQPVWESARRYLQRPVSLQAECPQGESTPIEAICKRTGVDLSSVVGFAAADGDRTARVAAVEVATAAPMWPAHAVAPVVIAASSAATITIDLQPARSGWLPGPW